MPDLKSILGGVIFGLAMGIVAIGVFSFAQIVTPPISERDAVRDAYEVAFERCAEQLETVDAERLAGCVERARAIAKAVRQQI